MRRCSVKKVFLEISQNSGENTCARKKETLAHVFSFEFCEISKNTFSNRTPLVVPSEHLWWLMDLIEPNFIPKGTNKYQLELDVYICFTDTLEELDQLGKISFWSSLIGYAVVFDV